MRSGSHHLTRKGLFVFVALVLVGGFLQRAAPPASAASGGPVVLMGIDAEDGGSTVTGPSASTRLS